MESVENNRNLEREEKDRESKTKTRKEWNVNITNEKNGSMEQRDGLNTVPSCTQQQSKTATWADIVKMNATTK